jgi:hypothetical protein
VVSGCVRIVWYVTSAVGLEVAVTGPLGVQVCVGGEDVAGSLADLTINTNSYSIAPKNFGEQPASPTRTGSTAAGARGTRTGLMAYEVLRTPQARRAVEQEETASPPPMNDELRNLLDTLV